MTKRSIGTPTSARASEKYGALKEGVHVAGYTLERAVATLDDLLKGDDWRSVGPGFTDINAFLDSIQLDSFRTSIEQRKRIAKRIKELQPRASNVRIGKVLGANEKTIRRATSANAEAEVKNDKQNNGPETPISANAEVSVSGAQAAKIVQRRTADVGKTQERRAERERELGAKIVALPSAKFGVILADPEWHDDVYSEQTGMNRHASRHYTTSTLEEIKTRPVADIAAADCVLFLWSTNQHLRDAFAVMDAWGFEYQSNYIWRKPSIGLGYWNRSVHEILLIGTRGKVPAPALGTQWESVIDAERGEHSAKPEIFLQMIEQYFPTLPKIELNRRGATRAGWSAWGNETVAPDVFAGVA